MPGSQPVARSVLGPVVPKQLVEAAGVGSAGVWALMSPWPGRGLGCLLAGQFLSSHKAARDQHRRRKTASQRVHLVLPSPELEGMDSEEGRRFAAFMDQLGTDNASEE